MTVSNKPGSEISMPDTDQSNNSAHGRFSLRIFEHPLLAVISYLLRKQPSALDWDKLVKDQGTQLIGRTVQGELVIFGMLLATGIILGTVVISVYESAIVWPGLIVGLTLMSLSAYSYHRRQQQLASSNLHWIPDGIGYYLLVKLVQPILFDAKATAYYAEHSIVYEEVRELLKSEVPELPVEKALREKLREIAHRLACLIEVSDDRDLRPKWSKAIHDCLQYPDSQQQLHYQKLEEGTRALLDVLETLQDLEKTILFYPYVRPSEEVAAAYRTTDEQKALSSIHPFHKWSMTVDAALEALKRSNHTMIGCHCEWHSKPEMHDQA